MNGTEFLTPPGSTIECSAAPRQTLLSPGASVRPAEASGPDMHHACRPPQSGKSCPSSLLLLSLQRLDKAKHPFAVAADSPAASRPGNPAPSSLQQPATGLVDSAFDVNELDPLPFLDRRDDHAEFCRQPSAPRPKADTPAKPGDGRSTSDRHAESNSSLQKPSAGSRPGIDRRRLPRREGDCAVVACPYTSDERLTPEKAEWLLHSAKMKGRLVDVSMSGVALQMPEGLSPGTRIALRISNRILDRHVNSTATVLRCREEPDGAWSIVCRFDKNLTFDQIHVIGRSLFASTIV